MSINEQQFCLLLGVRGMHASSSDMMAAAVAVVGVSSASTTAKRRLVHSLHAHDHHTPKNHYPIKALKQQQQQQQHLNTTATSSSLYNIQHEEEEEEEEDAESSLEALLLLQKSMLEKQLNLSSHPPKRPHCHFTSSGISARQRRVIRKSVSHNTNRKKHTVSPNLLGYIKGGVTSEDDLLTHAQVVHLSNKIKAGIAMEDYKSKLNKRLGYHPSDQQLATSLGISRAELQSKLIESSLAREKLSMSNVRLVMSIAQKYDNMGAQMPDLVQGGLIGLVRGIEKFDPSKGFKISTYVYWWIRQGVSRALVENSRTLRLPSHLHERLSLIRNAKIRLEGKGITPSIERIAECLNMSQKKVRNATEAISKVFSLDREAFPSLNGLPGETLHSYIADHRLENNPWHGVDEWTLKDEVNNLIKTTLREREQDIVRLYYGLDRECLTWEDISRRIGLSRERVRQVGLVALEKLKYAARRRRLEAIKNKSHKVVNVDEDCKLRTVTTN